MQFPHKSSRSSPTLLKKEGAGLNPFKVPLFKGDLEGSNLDLQPKFEMCVHGRHPGSGFLSSGAYKPEMADRPLVVTGCRLQF